jgi:hypothetical protein
MVFKEYNTNIKYNKLIVKTTTAISMAGRLPKFINGVAKEIEDEQPYHIEGVSGKNGSDTNHTPDKMDGLSKKKMSQGQRGAYLEYWIKILEDVPDIFTKITALVNKSIFSESAMAKRGPLCWTF